MSPGFFLNIAENTSDSFSYEILPAKDVKDISLRHHYPIVRNIFQPINLDCTNAPNIIKDNEYFTFWNNKGEGLFSKEELHSHYIPDRIKDIVYVTENEIKQLTSDHSSQTTDI